MSISNELCSDIAAALLVTTDKSELELTRLKEIVIEIQTALQQITEVERVGSSRLEQRKRGLAKILSLKFVKEVDLVHPVSG